ncbi:hypothetical protein MMC25_003134 [Agyrium rufum]|nr:hypothetical protein [Agyrium rufum]
MDVKAIWCFLLGIEFVAIFKCIPARALWQPDVPGQCIEIVTYQLGSSIPNIITDLLLLIFPISYVWRVQIAKKHRIAVIITFLLGGVVTVASTVRLVVVINLLRAHSTNHTYDFAHLIMWTIIEVNLGIVSACLPSLRPVLNLIVTGSARGSSQKSGFLNHTSSDYSSQRLCLPQELGSGGSISKAASTDIEEEQQWGRLDRGGRREHLERSILATSHSGKDGVELSGDGEWQSEIAPIGEASQPDIVGNHTRRR